MLGIIIGVFLFRTNSSYMSSELCKYFIAFSTDFSGKSYVEILSGFLSVNIIYFTIVIVMGTSALGDIPILIMTFIQSMGIGALTSYLFTTYGIRGFEYFLLVLFPGKIILIVASLLSAQNSLKSVLQIRASLKHALHEEYNLKLYLIRSLLVLAVMSVSCLVDSITIKLFASLFSLN
ncbi:MAG: stage II sporulation protein M [Acutalibacteraceae bacterium]